VGIGIANLRSIARISLAVPAIPGPGFSGTFGSP